MLIEMNSVKAQLIVQKSKSLSELLQRPPMLQSGKESECIKSCLVNLSVTKFNNNTLICLGKESSREYSIQAM